MKRIIVESRHLTKRTGISGFFLPLLDALITNYSDIKFILISDDKLRQYENVSNVKIKILNSPKWLRFNFFKDIYYGLFSFPRYLKNENVSLIISPYYDFFIPKKFKNKVIITIHDLCYFEHEQIYKIHTIFFAKFFLLRSIDLCNGIITVSNTSMKKLHNFFPKLKKNKRTIIIYNSFSLPQINFKKNYIFKELVQSPSKKLIPYTETE